MEHTLKQLRALLAEKSTPTIAGALRAALLQMIQAAQPGTVGSTIRMVPMSDVLYLEAADKYVRVFTADADYLIRTPLKDLLPQLDTNTFGRFTAAPWYAPAPLTLWCGTKAAG